jgi:hypothetical protein
LSAKINEHSLLSYDLNHSGRERYLLHYCCESASRQVAKGKAGAPIYLLQAEGPSKDLEEQQRRKVGDLFAD